MISLVILSRSRITWILLLRITYETIVLILARLVEEVTIVIIVVEDRIILLLLFYIPQPELQLELLYLSPPLRHPADSLIYPFALLLPRSRPDFTRRSDTLTARNKNILAEITQSPATQLPRSR
jgi:hypothetical protein